MEKEITKTEKKNQKKEKANQKTYKMQSDIKINSTQQNQAKNSKSELLISVVIPLYNEEESIPETCIAIKRRASGTNATDATK
jgi:hypothetical protein